MQALFFDIRKSTFSVGSNVRDAAAYVLWSLARTQQKDIMRPFAQDLAQKLIIATLFDREIHIRRAASAAFQEYVGRLVDIRHLAQGYNLTSKRIFSHMV